jgi:hypothetical protein
VIINIRPWSYKKSGSSGDTKERSLIGQYGLKPRGGLVRQLIRYAGTRPIFLIFSSDLFEYI